MTTLPLTEIAAWIHGELVGDESVVIHDALPLQDADAHSITLADNAKYAARLENSGAAAAVVPVNFPKVNKPVIRVENPHAAFELIVRRLRPASTSQFAGIHPQAIVHQSAEVGSGTIIQAGAIVEEGVVIGRNCTIHGSVTIMAGSRLGDGCILFPATVLYPATILEDRVLIHAGAILGAYGFGYRLVNGRHERTAQLGWVHVEADVEIGAGTTIDRGTFGATRIGMGTKIDNQVQIAHNCHIGPHNLICAHVGIAGSCVTGKYVVMAGQVGMKDHTRIGDRVVIGAQAGVMNDISEGEVVVGSPALPHRQTMLQVAALARLPEMRRQMRALQREVEELSKQVAASEIPPVGQVA